MNAVSRIEKEPFIPVDEWKPREEDKVFTEINGAIVAPINKFFGLEDNSDINYFILTSKRCYNSNTTIKDGETRIGFREHNTTYLNYFEKFYDREHYLLSIFAHIKYCIDVLGDNYTEDNFVADLNKYIILDQCNPILHYNIYQMNMENYITMTSKYKNVKNPCLEYSDYHTFLLMEASLLENMIIPLVSHFIYIKRIPIPEVKRVLLRCFDLVFVMIKGRYGVDLISKIYETINTNVTKDRNHNSQLWDMQEIRAVNTTTHSISTIENIVMQIIPKYVYNQSVVSFNYNAIIKDIRYKVIEIPYEYHFIHVSSSIRDEDNNSQADKFEAHMSKLNEALSLLIKVNCTKEMERIEYLYGPFNEDEIAFYTKRLLKDDGKHIKDDFQFKLVSYMFMSEFGDTSSIKYVNNRQYVMLMIAAKRKLQRAGLFLLADIISSKMKKIIARKTINSRIKSRMQMSENYEKLKEKYKNDDIIDTLFGFIAKTLASEFEYIDYYNKELDGKEIICTPEIVCEEFIRYALLI